MPPTDRSGRLRVGLTFDLRETYLAEGYGEEETAEFDRPDTIEAIDSALTGLGCQTDRIGHARQLIARLAAGDRWDLVFNIAEGLFGLGREAQVPAILDVYRIPYTFSDPLVMALCLHKGLTKTVVRAAGVLTADFAVVERPEDIARVDLPYPLFAKPIAEGTGKGIGSQSRIESPATLRASCLAILEQFGQPVLVETYLPGREFTVGVVGTGPEARVVGGMEVHFRSSTPSVYSYATKRDYEELVDYSPLEGELAAPIGAMVLDAWRALGCRDGGRIDVRLDAAGAPRFIEVNPLPGLNPTHSDLPMLCRMAGMDFHTLIGEIFTSARRRISCA